MTFGYVSASPSLPNPQTTSMSSPSLWEPLKDLSPLLTLVKLLLAKDCITDGRGIFFLVSMKKLNHQVFFFGKARDSPAPLEDSEDQGKVPYLSAYTPTLHRTMKCLEYYFESKPKLNFGKGRCTIPLPRSQKESILSSATIPRGNLGTSCQFHRNPNLSFNQDHSSDTTTRESDMSIRALFVDLSVNIFF